MGVVASLSTVDIPLDGRVSGKVREAWPLPDRRRLLVTTDRLSAFDRVIGAVPHKGQVLNQLAAWWFAKTADIVDNHVIDTPDPNALLAVDASPLPVEVVVRGRLTGSTSTSLLPRYQEGERVLYGYTLRDGLTAHGPLDEPLITPTTKAEKGEHDQPVTCDEVVELGLVEAGLWAQVQKVALELFRRGVELAADAGFVLADTKYEFGLAPDGRLLLIDEVHTPDSSRFWALDSLEERLAAGKSPESFDKEPVRLALKQIGYAGDGEPPTLPDEVWQETSARYVRLYEALTGLTFEPGAQPADERLATNLAPFVAEAAEAAGDRGCGMRVVILSGSPRDAEWVDKIATVLDDLAVPVVRRIGSAHRVPEHVLDLLRTYDRDDEATVFITVAGMSDALSGLSDATVMSPVVACPPRSDAFAGLDVLSSLRTPPGVAPIVALEPANAALAAAKVLGLGDPALRERIAAHQAKAAKRVLDGDEQLAGGAG